MNRINEQINDIDVIVPCHFPVWNFLDINVRAWLNELPLGERGRLYFGMNHPEDSVQGDVRKFLSQFKNIEFIDQRGIKTLGFQLKDLMDRVNTDWFVYCHVDAQPCHNSFFVLEADALEEENVGIVESERVQYSYDEGEPIPKIPKDYPWYYFRERAFSGYQLIKTHCLLDILSKIEDDYIYRNEDIIFQNACEKTGFKYKKSMAMHFHTPQACNRKWTPQGNHENELEANYQTFEMQVRGIVKYCDPTPLAVDCFFAALAPQYHWYKKKHGTEWDIFDFVEQFVENINPKWKKPLSEKISTGILRYYK